MSKTRGRIKKVCCCGVSWFLIGVIFVIIGILLLSYYSKFWSDNTNWRRGLAYAGVVFLLLGLIMIGIGITFCVALYIVWNRLDKSGDFAKHQFKPPAYPPGHAPYPQQGTTSPVYTQVSSSDQPSQPSAPTMEPPKTDNQDVHVEITEQQKF